MATLTFQGKLLIGVLATLGCAAPLACSSDGDDTAAGGSGGASGGSSGHGGTAGSTTGGHTSLGGSSATGGSATGGSATGGSNTGGSATGGSGGGHAGTAGTGGSGAGTGGAAGGPAGAGGDDSEGGMAGDMGAAGAAPTFDDYAAAVCMTEVSLNCGSDTQASCVQSEHDTSDFGCSAEYLTVLRCLAPKPASDFACMDSMAYPKDGVCGDENTALNNCYINQ